MLLGSHTSTYFIDDNCVAAVEPITQGLYHTISCHWLLMPSGLDTHTGASTHTNVQSKSNFKKPTCDTWFKNHFYAIKFHRLGKNKNILMTKNRIYGIHDGITQTK